MRSAIRFPRKQLRVLHLHNDIDTRYVEVCYNIHIVTSLHSTVVVRVYQSKTTSHPTSTPTPQCGYLGISAELRPELCRYPLCLSETLEPTTIWAEFEVLCSTFLSSLTAVSTLLEKDHKMFQESAVLCPSAGNASLAYSGHICSRTIL